MACSKYEYVKQYELDDRLLPGCWIVVRLDGKGFTKCAATARRCRPPAAAAAAPWRLLAAECCCTSSWLTEAPLHMQVLRAAQL